MKKIKCYKCGKEHNPSLSNCRWIYCSCGETLCSQCGSGNIGTMDMDDDDDAQYWYRNICKDCGLQRYYVYKI